MVSVIMPAWNEASTIADAVAEVVGHPAVTEIIVVDDGSTDDTAVRARQAGADVIRLPRNGGKAAAMDAGVRAAHEDTLLFLDADVTGLDHATISRILGPVLSGQYEMYVGIRARSTMLLNQLLHFFPIIGGERALTRRLWEAVPSEHKHGFRIEIALNYTAKRSGRGMGFELIRGTVHHTKERKYGIVAGLRARHRLNMDVLAVSFNLYVLESLRRGAGVQETRQLPP